MRLVNKSSRSGGIENLTPSDYKRFVQAKLYRTSRTQHNLLTLASKKDRREFDFQIQNITDPVGVSHRSLIFKGDPCTVVIASTPQNIVSDILGTPEEDTGPEVYVTTKYPNDNRILIRSSKNFNDGKRLFLDIVDFVWQGKSFDEVHDRFYGLVQGKKS